MTASLTAMRDQRSDHGAAPLLVVDALTKSFGGVVALRDVSFGVAPGEVVALIGPNGAGKTTCFNVIHGELVPDRGDARLAGRSIRGLAPHAIAHLGVGRTFQVAATFASMTVRESLALALAAHDGRDGAVLTGKLGIASQRIEALLARVAIADLADARVQAVYLGQDEPPASPSSP